MTALREWQDELAAGERTIGQWDALHFDACKAAEDAEMYAYLRPVRLEVARLQALQVDPVTESAADPVADIYPALDQWRMNVLERGGSPLEVAAAWEMTALVCLQDGASHLVDECHHNAAAALGVAA
jgi:hypothetical protein